MLLRDERVDVTSQHDHRHAAAGTSLSSNLRRSNLAPSSFCAFVRRRLISL